MAASGPRITARSFPTPELEKVVNNPAVWDQWQVEVAQPQAAEANLALALLDERLAVAQTHRQRVEAFGGAYWHVADWQLASLQAQLPPGTSVAELRAPIEQRRGFTFESGENGPEAGSPAAKMLGKCEQIARNRLRIAGGDGLQNVVQLPNGRSVFGNQLQRIPDGQGTAQLRAGEVMTVSAAFEDRASLRQGCFEGLARLEGLRAEAGGLNMHSREHRDAYADATYCLIQGPELTEGNNTRRTNDIVLQPYLVAAHTRLFDVAPILPQAVDLHGQVTDQRGFRHAMSTGLRPAPAPADPGRTPPTAATTRAATGVTPRDLSGGMTR